MNPNWEARNEPDRSISPRPHTPDTGPDPHVAVLVIHRTANFLSLSPTRELSKRGFLVLAMNPRSDNNEASVDFERNALDIKSGIEFLRNQPGITQVILFGHSGGGAATTFYQAVAENSPSYCQGADKRVECPDDLAGLPLADGIVLMDAHPGISVKRFAQLQSGGCGRGRSSPDRPRSRPVQSR